MAGRIPDAFIQDLIARTDIVELIGSRVELKRAGKEFKARSPFTNEKSPSFFVSPQKQMFFCFSSGKNGTAINFLMEYDRLSFVEAVEELARRAGLEVPHEGGNNEPRVVVEGPLDALAGAQRFFRDQLRTAPAAIAYLKQRGVSGETAKRFGIGYAPEAWDALTGFLKETRHAVDAGLLIERDSGGVYDRFRNRITFPIRDTRGRVIAFGGRTLGNDPAKYLNSPETVLFHKGRNLYGLYEARQSTSGALPYLVVVEGYMDVVMLSQYGIHEAVGTLGTATTREHLQLLFKSTSKIVFCFDGDRAGRSAAWRALEQALPEMGEGRECVFLFVPDGQDPDSWVQEIGTDAFREHIQKAIPLSQYLLGELSRQVNLGSLEGRARLAALAKPLFAKLREGPLRSLMLDELGRLTRLSRGDLESMTPRADATLPDAGNTTAPLPREPRGTNPVRRALQLLMEQPALAEHVDHLELLHQADVRGIEVLIEAIDFFQAHPDASAGQLVELWKETPKGRGIQQLMLEALPLDDSLIEGEFRATMLLLSQKAQRTRAQQLLAEAGARNLTAAETRELQALMASWRQDSQP